MRNPNLAKERTTQRLWQGDRVSVADAIQELGLPQSKYRMLGIREWQWIERRVKDRFVRRPFSERTGIWFEDVSPAEVALGPSWDLTDLKELAPAGTRVYAAHGADFGDLWWCEGMFASAVEVHFSANRWLESVFVSPSFEWLLVTNHHDMLYAIGEPVSSNLAQHKNAQRIAK